MMLFFPNYMITEGYFYMFTNTLLHLSSSLVYNSMLHPNILHLEPSLCSVTLKSDLSSSRSAFPYLTIGDPVPHLLLSQAYSPLNGFLCPHFPKSLLSYQNCIYLCCIITLVICTSFYTE